MDGGASTRGEIANDHGGCVSIQVCWCIEEFDIRKLVNDGCVWWDAQRDACESMRGWCDAVVAEEREWRVESGEEGCCSLLHPPRDGCCGASESSLFSILFPPDPQ